MGEEKGDDFGDIHGFVATVAWLGLQQLGLWSNYFKNTRYGTAAHGFFMTLTLLCMVGVSGLIIGNFGLSVLREKLWLHNLVGFGILCMCPLIFLSGSLCRFTQQDPRGNPSTIEQYNFRHSIFGWVVILLSKFPLYTRRHGFTLVMLMLIDGIATGLYLYLKFRGKKSEQRQIPAQQPPPTQALKTFKSEEEVRQHYPTFIVFEGLIYDPFDVLAVHPGGSRLIQSVLGQDVDRYMYGVESSYQFPEIRPHSHLLRSISLAGQSIGRVASTRKLFSKMYDLNQARLISVEQFTNIFFLKLSLPNLKYNGYAELSELGKHYSVTFDGKMTRLYTMVNFLQPRNTQLMNEITGERVMREDEMKSINSTVEDSCITLLIKKYETGRFTSAFLKNENFTEYLNIKISSPQGFGLGFSDDNAGGAVALLAAGTGLYPFSDTIDLLFKQMLVNQKSALSDKIMSQDPLISTSALNKFSFTLYLTVKYFAELHPLTLHQCDALSKSGMMRCYVKIGACNEQAVREKYPNLVLLSDRFETIIQNRFKDPEISKVLICGPAHFSKVMVEALHSAEIKPNKIKVI